MTYLFGRWRAKGPLGNLFSVSGKAAVLPETEKIFFGKALTQQNNPMPESDPSLPARLIALAAGVLPEISILSDEACVLGRSPGCHIVIRHALTSRRHAQIERHGTGYILRDNGSANGTFVNGKRVTQPHVLQDCDLLGLGSPDAMLQCRLK